MRGRARLSFASPPAVRSHSPLLQALTDRVMGERVWALCPGVSLAKGGLEKTQNPALGLGR